MKRDPNPSTAALVAGGARWCAVLTVTFLFTFPFWARPLLDLLSWILTGLNNFGVR